MSMRTAELVSEWETVSFEGGYDGLHTLADREFSGAVIAGPARLFMLRGTVVGILDGDLEQFEDSGGTARKAPHDALPLLAVMQARAGESRAQYYTEDTALSEVDATLSDGGFTGFVELSENVLSGDYYLVYHQGRSMTIAWTGSSQRLITDDEAFEKANDEVGIYDVYPADIEPIELPETQGSGAGETSTGEDETNKTHETDISDRTSGTETVDDQSGASTDTTVGTGRPNDTTPTPGDEDGWFDEETEDPESASETGPSSVEQVSPAQAKSETHDRPQTEETEVSDTDSTVETSDTDSQTTTQQSETEPREPEPRSPAPESADSGVGDGDQSESDPTEKRPETIPSQDSGPATTTDSADDTAEVSTALEVKSIPSLDPDRSQSKVSQPDSMIQPTTTRAHPEPEPTTEVETESGVDIDPDNPEQSAQLEDQLAEQEDEIQRLQAELDERTAENEDLTSERNRLREELSEARSEIQRLQSELDDIDVHTDANTADAVQLSVTEAIDGTNLFVRYRSKSGATLTKATDESVDRSSVAENLRLEYHTQFEDEAATVDGQEFEAFLTGTIRYRFVQWLVQNLLYEIRDTGNASSMSQLYDALPKIDRAELNGQVSITYTEDGEEHRTQEQFDVVVRDRMGNPLIVANINDSRQPATGGQMQNIVRDAEHVGNTSESLAAAFLVTNSFFEPEALETAEEATSSGLLSRDKGKSFVNLSRKDGYHLCLLEARNDEFHLAVPEL
jgi:hypothetical protein